MSIGLVCMARSVCRRVVMKTTADSRMNAIIYARYDCLIWKAYVSSQNPMIMFETGIPMAEEIRSRLRCSLVMVMNRLILSAPNTFLMQVSFIRDIVKTRFMTHSPMQATKTANIDDHENI